jgi:hypothetical protein
MRRPPRGRKSRRRPLHRPANRYERVAYAFQHLVLRGRIALSVAMLGALAALCSVWIDGGLDPFSIPAVILGLRVLGQPR